MVATFFFFPSIFSNFHIFDLHNLVSHIWGRNTDITKFVFETFTNVWFFFPPWHPFVLTSARNRNFNFLFCWCKYFNIVQRTAWLTHFHEDRGRILSTTGTHWVSTGQDEKAAMTSSLYTLYYCAYHWNTWSLWLQAGWIFLLLFSIWFTETMKVSCIQLLIWLHVLLVIISAKALIPL